MKYFTLCAALLLCGSAQAATYVYQVNAYQGHERCGRRFLPAQVTITVAEALPPNSNLSVPLKTFKLKAGYLFHWSKGYSKTNSDIVGFTTNSNGDITQWSVSAATSGGRGFFTQNETGDVIDLVEFKCGSAGVDGNPGTWTRTQ